MVYFHLMENIEASRKPSPGRPWLPGQSGNPNGRPKGARNKLEEDFIRDLHEAWKRDGKAAIDAAYAEQPELLLRMVASVLGKRLRAASARLEGTQT